MEPPPGADPGHPRYEGRAAAVRGGKDRTSGGHRNSWGTRTRTWMNVAVSRSRAGRVADYTIPHCRWRGPAKAHTSTSHTQRDAQATQRTEENS